MIAKTATDQSPNISYFEISRLACMNWQKDGCPSGRDLDYWIEAEKQIKAARQLAISGNKAHAGRKSEPVKAGPNGTRKTPARPALG